MERLKVLRERMWYGMKPPEQGCDITPVSGDYPLKPPGRLLTMRWVR